MDTPETRYRASTACKIREDDEVPRSGNDRFLEILYIFETNGKCVTSDGKEYIVDNIEEFYKFKGVYSKLEQMFPSDEIIYLRDVENYDIDNDLDYTAHILYALINVLNRNDLYKCFLNGPDSHKGTEVGDHILELETFIGAFAGEIFRNEK